MQASVEISLYPLNIEYVKYIQEFIENINKNKNLIIETNGMSTQIFGDYHEIMKTLTDEVYNSFQKTGVAVFVFKIVNAFLKQ
jgi:uncharacterized protein YqgV (UPF0045/DUF77 family)